MPFRDIDHLLINASKDASLLARKRSIYQLTRYLALAGILVGLAFVIVDALGGTHHYGQTGANNLVLALFMVSFCTSVLFECNSKIQMLLFASAISNSQGT